VEKNYVVFQESSGVEVQRKKGIGQRHTLTHPQALQWIQM
jgi:hypothetical protein